MKVLVCGSRHFEDEGLLRSILDTKSISKIIHGMARGADRMGGAYAERNGIPVDAYPALWNTYGRRAGPIRNAQMLKEGQPDLVVAFRGPNSRGTQNMITQARKANIPVEVIDIEKS